MRTLYGHKLTGKFYIWMCVIPLIIRMFVATPYQRCNMHQKWPYGRATSPLWKWIALWTPQTLTCLVTNCLLLACAICLHMYVLCSFVRTFLLRCAFLCLTWTTGCFTVGHMCIDNVIHDRAGPRLREECSRLMARQGHALEPTGIAASPFCFFSFFVFFVFYFLSFYILVHPQIEAKGIVWVSPFSLWLLWWNLQLTIFVVVFCLFVFSAFACSWTRVFVVGSAKITQGYCLPAKHVLHTVGPIITDPLQLRPDELTSCYTYVFFLDFCFFFFVVVFCFFFVYSSSFCPSFSSSSLHYGLFWQKRHSNSLMRILYALLTCSQWMSEPGKGIASALCGLLLHIDRCVRLSQWARRTSGAANGEAMARWAAEWRRYGWGGVQCVSAEGPRDLWASCTAGVCSWCSCGKEQSKSVGWRLILLIVQVVLQKCTYVQKIRSAEWYRNE